MHEYISMFLVVNFIASRKIVNGWVIYIETCEHANINYDFRLCKRDLSIIILQLLSLMSKDLHNFNRNNISKIYFYI
jgi:hypothetical protein